jgi:Na+-driven multidrug efflux pump
VDGVWLAFPIADILAFVLVLVMLIPQIRNFRQMAAEAETQTVTEFTGS